MFWNKSKRDGKVGGLPYPVYAVMPVALSIFGVLVSLYLAYSHFLNYGDLNYSSFCSISNTINCDTVAQSPWSIFAGLPVAYWGMLGYIVLVILTVPVSYQRKRTYFWAPIIVISGIYSVISIMLGYISANIIKAYCIPCIFTYLANFLIFGNSWFIYQKFHTQSFINNLSRSFYYFKNNTGMLVSLVSIFCLYILLWFSMPNYWEYSAKLPSEGHIASGVTSDFHPWLGAEEPVITVHEYTDYMCFQCAEAHIKIREIIARYPSKIRLIHHHYPLDHKYNSIVVKKPFHVGAGKMALMAIHAMTQGKFWEMNDALYEVARSRKPFSTKNLSLMTGVTSGELVAALNEPSYLKVLKRDIKQGLKLRIISTPTFVVDEQLYIGDLPVEIFEDVFN